MLDFSYDKMFEALGSAVLYHQVIINPNDSLAEEFIKVMQVQGSFADTITITDTTSYLRKFKYSYDRAGTYRLAEVRDSAINAAEAIQNWVYSFDEDRLDNFICITSLEKEIIDSAYSFDLIDSLLQNACPYSYFEEFQQQQVQSNSNKNSYIKNHLSSNNDILVKNPVSSILSIIIPGLEQSTASIQIFNTDGKKIIDQMLKGGNFEFDMTSYPSGLYLIKISKENKEYTRKVMKE